MILTLISEFYCTFLRDSLFFFCRDVSPDHQFWCQTLEDAQEEGKDLDKAAVQQNEWLSFPPLQLSSLSLLCLRGGVEGFVQTVGLKLHGCRDTIRSCRDQKVLFFFTLFFYSKLDMIPMYPGRQELPAGQKKAL